MGHLKVTASIAEDLVRRLDDEARRRDVSRSSLLTELVDRYFRQLDREAFQAGIRSALSGQSLEERAEQDAWLEYSRKQAARLLDDEEW